MSEKEQGSIFPEKMPVLNEENRVNILNEMENLNTRAAENREHVLSRSEYKKEEFNKRNDIAYLVRTGHPLPEVESAEQMLTGSTKREETPEKQEQSPYRMVNLIAGSYRLPEIDEENFLK